MATSPRTIQVEVVAIPAKLPEVTIEEIWKGRLYAVTRNESGILCQWEVRRENIEMARNCAYDALAIANRIEEYLDSEEHATKQLQERRDTLTSELVGTDFRYNAATVPVRKAVDHIIRLENELQAAAQ